MGVDKNDRSKHTGRFVRLGHSLLSSPAYRAASPQARALLVELAMMDSGKNNGTMFMSVRDAADRMGALDINTARAAIDELTSLGFIEATAESYFAMMDGNGSRARQWRLTWLAMPSKSKPPTHDYEHARPTDPRAQKRMAKGRKALERWTRKQNGGSKSHTLKSERVWESHTVVGNDPPAKPAAVLESHTLDSATPLVSVETHCVENPYTYSLPARGPSDGQADQRKHAENGGRRFRNSLNGDAANQLRGRLNSFLAKAPVGAQSRLAKSASIPNGTLSKFKEGRGLPASHFINLESALIDIERRDAA